MIARRVKAGLSVSRWLPKGRQVHCARALVSPGPHTKSKGSEGHAWSVECLLCHLLPGRDPTDVKRGSAPYPLASLSIWRYSLKLSCFGIEEK